MNQLQLQEELQKMQHELVEAKSMLLEQWDQQTEHYQFLPALKNLNTET